MDEQVQGYLMRAKTLFEELTDTPEDSYKYGHFRDFQIYIPSENAVLGYFKDKDFNLSDINFYGKANAKQIKKLSTKISKGKFVRKVKINGDLLKTIESAENALKKGKSELGLNYQLLVNDLNIKSQK